MRASRHQPIAFVLLGLVAACSCGNDRLRRIVPDFKVVDGTPQVDRGLPVADDRPPTTHPGDFQQNVPIQIDLFRQLTLRAVDILWVIDSSGSMAPKQQRVKSQFTSFIQFLTNANPPVDYHIGVVTTDMADPARSGRLLGEPGATSRFICRNLSGTEPSCAPGDPVASFQNIVAAVGTCGSGHEQPLLAAGAALSEPLASNENQGFLRKDASLYIIILSDEEDASCNNPLANSYCSANMAPKEFGSVDYWVRFFQGTKGYGNAQSVAVASIVATTANPFQAKDCGLGQCGAATGQCEDVTNNGCTVDPGGGATPTEFARYAPRLVKVATRTGGIATSICDKDYSSALGALGFAVSGLRRDYALTRGPIESSIAVTVRGTADDCSASPCYYAGYGQTCDAASKTCDTNPHPIPPDAANGWTYVGCENGTFRNVVRFHGTAIPAPLSNVEVKYNVDVSVNTKC